MNSKHVICVIAFSVFTAFLGQGLVLPLLPVYAKEIGARGFEIGLIFSCFSMAQILFLSFIGRTSGRKGRKLFITVGLFTYFLASIAYVYADTVLKLMIIRFVQGACSVMILPVAQAYAGDLSPTGREGLYLGFINVAQMMGLAAGPIIGGIIKDMYGYSASFAGFGIVCFFGFLISVLFLPSYKLENRLVSQKPEISYRLLLSDSNVPAISLFRFSQFFCISVLWTFIPLLAVELFHLSSTIIGLTIAVLILLGAATAFPAGHLSDRIDKRLLTIISGLVTAGAVCGVALNDSVFGFFTAAAFAGIGFGMATTVNNAMGAVIGKNKKSMGSVVAILFFGQSAAMFFGPIISGMIMDMASLKTALLFGAGVLTITMSVFLVLSRTYISIEDTLRG